MTETVREDNLKLAIGAILVACFALSLGDALIKQQSVTFVLWQIFVLRSAMVLPFLGLYMVRELEWSAPATSAPTNSQISRAIWPRWVRDTALATNISTPTGGVIWPITRTASSRTTSSVYSGTPNASRRR